MICGICGRTLKDVKSIERGYGPICYQKLNPHTVSSGKAFTKQSGSVFEDESYAVPGQMELSEFMDMPKGEESD